MASFDALYKISVSIFHMMSDHCGIIHCTEPDKNTGSALPSLCCSTGMPGMHLKYGNDTSKTPLLRSNPDIKILKLMLVMKDSSHSLPYIQ
jgi:hypothetical protein